MTDIQREESFRSAIKNQKRRLSATKVEKRNSLTPDAGFTNPPARVVPLALKQRRDSMTPPRRDGMTPPRRDGLTPPTSNRSTPARTTEPISIHKSELDGSQPDIRLEFWNIEELSPLSTPATSPRPSPRNSPSPTPMAARNPSRSPSPRPLNSPIPPGSPLLSPHTISPALKRARSFNKDLRRAASFRAQRDRSCSRNSSRVSSRCVSPDLETEPVIVNNNIPQEVSFSIKRTLGTRKGWKIMPEDGGELEGDALRKVVNMIKDIEFQGFAVPERITIKIP